MSSSNSNNSKIDQHEFSQERDIRLSELSYLDCMANLYKLKEPKNNSNTAFEKAGVAFN
jgi:hypothetical protein